MLGEDKKNAGQGPAGRVQCSNGYRSTTEQADEVGKALIHRELNRRVVEKVHVTIKEQHIAPTGHMVEEKDAAALHRA